MSRKSGNHGPTPCLFQIFWTGKKWDLVTLTILFWHSRRRHQKSPILPSFQIPRSQISRLGLPSAAHPKVGRTRSTLPTTAKTSQPERSIAVLTGAHAGIRRSRHRKSNPADSDPKTRIKPRHTGVSNRLTGKTPRLCTPPERDAPNFSIIPTIFISGSRMRNATQPNKFSRLASRPTSTSTQIPTVSLKSAFSR